MAILNIFIFIWLNRNTIHQGIVAGIFSGYLDIE